MKDTRESVKNKSTEYLKERLSKIESSINHDAEGYEFYDALVSLSICYYIMKELKDRNE